MLDSAPIFAAAQPAHGVVGTQAVGLGPHPGEGHRLADARIAVSQFTVGAIQLDQLLGGGLETRRRAQQQATLETGGGHRHMPALALVTDAVGHRHAHIVEEDFGERILAVERLNRADGHAGSIQRHHQETQAVVPAGRRIAAEQAEGHVGEAGAGRPVFWPLST